MISWAQAAFPMLRKLLQFLSIGAAAAAQPPNAPTVVPDAAKIFPYIVPASYFESVGEGAKAITWPLGHDLHIALVHDLNGMVRNVVSEDLAVLRLTKDEAKAKAIENLETLAASGSVGQQLFAKGPTQRPFILFGGHWATAACLLLPDLHSLGLKHLAAEEFCVAIPHREALLIFPKGDKAHRAEMIKLIQKNESEGRKPLTFALFELTARGIKPLSE